MIADKWEIPRSELDEIGVRSHQLAHQATEEGRFEREIVPFQVNGDTYVTDQGIRPDTNLEALSQLKPAFKEDGKITAGNSSQISDGAAAVLLMEREKAESLGLKPRARIVDQTTVGVDPVIMLTGPIPATKKLLERNGMKIGDIDLFEINEAFASVVAAWRRELEPDMDRVNVNGGAIALGHPLGSTGARLITTLLHELERSDKEIGLVTMCCGGGLGTGTLIQRVCRHRLAPTVRAGTLDAGTPADVPVSTQGTLLAGRYRVLRHLGSGGMASVLLCQDERLGRQVAVKRLHADSPADVEQRFVREAKLGASLNHPNLVVGLRHRHRRRGRADRHGVRGGRVARAGAAARAARPAPGRRAWRATSARRSTTPTATASCTAT